MQANPAASIDAITEAIIGDCIAIHRELGPGLLESTYEACLVLMLKRRGFRVDQQVAMPVVFQGELLEIAYRLDLLVEGRVVVELKTVTALEAVHFAQVSTYLKHSGCEVGLLINFNVTRLVDGVRRIVRSYRVPISPPTPSNSPAPNEVIR